MIVRLKAITDGDDSLDLRVECTQSKWEALIAPAVLENLPIDGQTVNHQILDQLYDRPPVKGRAKHTVLIV